MRKNEDAVSPVVGVILMVAITVVLAAIIAAFVFGMGSSLKKTYTVALTASQTGIDTIRIVNNGGPDIGAVTSLTCDVNGTFTALGISVGNATTVTDATRITAGLRDPVTCTGVFTDGTSQVLLDTLV
jgi:flagellin-like protein